MAILDIIHYPDPLLKQQSAEIISYPPDQKLFIDNMIETMYAAEGIGLAAPQVGVLKRIAVIDVSREQDTPLVFVNPTIVSQHGSIKSEEGCLSIPGYRDTVPRSTNLIVRAQDSDGKEFSVEADGLLAICLQHEIDHLDGILFIDRMSRIKRELFKRWFKKQLES
jgi:peptide deformylase